MQLADVFAIAMGLVLIGLSPLFLEYRKLRRELISQRARELAFLRLAAPDFLPPQPGREGHSADRADDAANGGQSGCKSVGGRAHLPIDQPTEPVDLPPADVHPVHGLVPTAAQRLPTVPAAYAAPGLGWCCYCGTIFHSANGDGQGVAVCETFIGEHGAVATARLAKEGTRDA